MNVKCRSITVSMCKCVDEIINYRAKDANERSCHITLSSGRVLVLVRLRSIPVSAMGEMLLSYLTSRGDSESGSVGGRSVPGNIEIMVHSPSNLFCHHAPLEQGRDCSEAETGICQEQVRRPWEEQEVAMLMAHLPLLSQQHVDWPSGQSHQHERPSVPEQR